MFDQKAYTKKWKQENKDKVKEYNKRYYHKNKLEIDKAKKEWRENNAEKVKEYNRKSHQKFTETHNWAKYCDKRRKARAERLRAQGVKNPWSVINGKEAKYE